MVGPVSAPRLLSSLVINEGTRLVSRGLCSDHPEDTASAHTH